MGSYFQPVSSVDCISISCWSMLGPGSQFNFTEELIPFVYSDIVNCLENQSPTCRNDQEINCQSLILVQPKMLKEAYPKYQMDTILL